MNLNIPALLDKAEGLLTGEPARIIGYGAAVVIFLVAKVLNVLPAVTPEVALGDATAAIVTLVTVIETIRHYVYSPATVAAITDEQGNG